MTVSARSRTDGGMFCDLASLLRKKRVSHHDYCVGVLVVRKEKCILDVSRRKTGRVFRTRLLAIE
jgi:hypothetical protein